MFGFLRRRPQRQIANIENGPGTYSVDVVGESHYQAALEDICGGRTEEGHRLSVIALLVPENDNPHDSEAVMVQIEGHRVGYLGRTTARSFREALGAVAPEGSLARCQALILGGCDRGHGDRGHFGVKLDLPLLSESE